MKVVMKRRPVEDSPDEQIKAAKRLVAIGDAHDDMMAFAKLLMPDPEDVSNPEMSRYVETPLARLLCDIIRRVAISRHKLKRVAVSVGPQTGKTQLLSVFLPAWISGRDPYAHVMLGTYNDTRANEVGKDVKDVMQSQAFRAVFPEHKLRKGGEANDKLMTEHGGKLSFVGMGGSGTGKPADYFIVDDPIRNDDDAQSLLYRERLWKWFNSVAFTRCHGNSAIIVLHTRWHQDDLIGRLCDPDHPERHKSYAGVADEWTYINLPVVVQEPKLAKALGLELELPYEPNVISQFGSKPMASLAVYPPKPLEFLAEAKRMDPRTFGALYMGQPAPEDGEYFKADWLVEYDRRELPKELKHYGASDHAVSLKQGRDYTVIGCVGIDENDDLWVLPDLVWERMEADRTVEKLIWAFDKFKPMMWWMEADLISKSFGPFLRKRMVETKTYVSIDPVVPSKDKPTRARAIQGRMSMKKVRFPRFAPWWNDARGQLLRFPFGANDDFVDWLSHIGMGLMKEVGAAPAKIEVEGPAPGSMRWILEKSAARARKENSNKAIAGW